MKYIYEINAKHEMVGPGVWSFEAEAKVTGPDTAEEVFVSVGEYDGMKSFKVSKTSAMACDENNGGGISEEELDEKIIKLQSGEDVDFGVGGIEPALEEYEKLSDAKASEYYPVFKALSAVLNAMSKPVG